FATSDGGLITSSAWYEPASPKTHGKNLVVFGGGYTLYALDADTTDPAKRLVWSHDYTGLPEQPADPAHDEARIFSSPIVVGGKDGTYYRVNPADGTQVWKTNVVGGGLAGGFLGTPAYDGQRVAGATALGDFGRFEGFGALGCDFPNPHDGLVQEPSIHAFN